VVLVAVTEDRPAREPVLRVIRGDASAEEIAALVAVLMARAAAVGEPEAPAPARSAWSERSRLVRQPLHPGPGAWRRSALPS
jgi:Acyl-CoA carboxylase epsilon subunit